MSENTTDINATRGLHTFSIIFFLFIILSIDQILIPDLLSFLVVRDLRSEAKGSRFESGC